MRRKAKRNGDDFKLVRAFAIVLPQALLFQSMSSCMVTPDPPKISSALANFGISKFAAVPVRFSDLPSKGQIYFAVR